MPVKLKVDFGTVFSALTVKVLAVADHKGGVIGAYDLGGLVIVSVKFWSPADSRRSMPSALERNPQSTPDRCPACPEMVAVPSPLSMNFTPPGRCPVWVIEGIGLPEVVTVKEE